MSYESSYPAPEKDDLDAQIAYSEEVQILRDELLKLDHRDRLVVSLYYFQGLKLHEIATVMGLTESRISQIGRKQSSTSAVTLSASGRRWPDESPDPSLVAMTALLAIPCPAITVETVAAEDQALSQDSGPAQIISAAFVGPEERVAAMVREALRAPQEQENWACLDLALTEMNAPAVEGQGRKSQAKRVADSLACSSGSVLWTASSSTIPPTRPGGPRGVGISDQLLNGAWHWVFPFFQKLLALLSREPWIVTGLLLLASAALIGVGRNPILDVMGRPRREHTLDSSSLLHGSHRPGSPENPIAMALALWEGGLPSPEIARRTGLAQDAVSVLLEPQWEDGPHSCGWPNRIRKFPHRHSHPNGEEIGLMGPGSLSRAGRAFSYWERRQEAVAHNLANASTPGFKGERVFASLLDSGNVSPASKTDFRPGALEPTGRPLDLALGGDGFMVLRTPEGDRLVRGGSFQLDASRQLVDAHGNTLQGDSGAIVLPEGNYEITPSGVVKVEDVPVAQLKIVRPREGAILRREGGVRFRADLPTREVEEGEVKVHQGHLEESNVDPVDAMVEMIEIQRAYSAIQRSVMVVDGVLGRISNELGKVR